MSAPPFLPGLLVPDPEVTAGCPEARDPDAVSPFFLPVAGRPGVVVGRRVVDPVALHPEEVGTGLQVALLGAVRRRSASRDDLVRCAAGEAEREENGRKPAHEAKIYHEDLMSLGSRLAFATWKLYR